MSVNDELVGETGGDAELSAVYLPYHFSDPEKIEDGCLLGVYSTREKAEARQRAAVLLPGFRLAMGS